MSLKLLILKVNLDFRNSLFFLQVNIMASPIDLDGATSLEQQAYLVGLKLQQLELAIEAGLRPNNTQIGFDTEANTVSMTINLSTTLSVNNGAAVITAVPYLT
jgi:hypothetical protein